MLHLKHRSSESFHGVVSFAFALILFSIIKATIGIRVSAEEETVGLDVTEHAMSSYTSVS